MLLLQLVSRVPPFWSERLLCACCLVAETRCLGPSLFGRDLTEQVRADSKGEQRSTPVIVEKCIDAVDFLGASQSFFSLGSSVLADTDPYLSSLCL